MHYEILETKKRVQEEEEAARLKAGPKNPPFVYNEQDFPSILQDLGSRYRSHDEDRKKRRKQEEDGKYMWITSKGKHCSLCVKKKKMKRKENEENINLSLHWAIFVFIFPIIYFYIILLNYYKFFLSFNNPFLFLLSHCYSCINILSFL